MFGLRFTNLYYHNFLYSDSFYLENANQRLRLQNFNIGESQRCASIVYNIFMVQHITKVEWLETQSKLFVLMQKKT